MRPFTQLDAVAAAIPEANIDTDQILPGRFLKTIKREGLGKVLFHSMRFDERGEERPEFVLNRHSWRSAGILIALDNFGCGSSREHAPWALADFGIRAVLATSFADIFRNNCYKNGILPIALPLGTIEQLIDIASDPEQARMSILLPSQQIITSTGNVIPFEILPEKKAQLLLGLDEIAATERLSREIMGFEGRIDYHCPTIPLDLVAAD